jgi:predicted ferric reductase
MLILAPLAVLSNTNLDKVAGNRILILNILQRISGSLAFAAMSVQIVLGSNMDYFRKILGKNALNIHITNGLFAYTAILIHPIMWIVINYFVRGKIDPYFPFVDICILCQNSLDWVYNFGRFGFWLATIAVIAGLFRGYNSFMRNNWRKFHILNYFAFLFVAIHSIFKGTDALTPIFLMMYILGVLMFLISVAKNYKKAISLFKDLD